MAVITGATIQQTTRRSSRPDDFPVPNLLMTTLVVIAAAAPFIPQDMGEATVRRSQTPHQIYLRAEANFVPFLPADLQLAHGYRPNPSIHPDQRFIGFPVQSPFNIASFDTPRRNRPVTDLHVPNLLGTTLVPSQNPFRPENFELVRGFRQPIHEHPRLNDPSRIPTGTPVKASQLEQETATRQRRPLLVDSHPINVPLNIAGSFPYIQRYDERQQVRSRPSQDSNTFLQPINLNLLGKDARGQFTFDWTLNYRRFRPNPEEPVFRNFLTAQPVQAPFNPVDYPSPSRRIRISDRPTLDINRLPLLAGIKPFDSGQWPDAPRRRQDIARYTFIQPVNLQLIGKDVFFNGPGRGPFNYDWKINFRRVSIERETLNDLQCVPLSLIQTALSGQLDVLRVLHEDRRYQIPVDHRRYKLKLLSRTFHVPKPPRDA